MKRLIKKANHVSSEMHEEVEKDIVDGERSLRRNSSDSYLIARQLVADTNITPTNEHMLIIMKDIDGGKYSNIGSSKENWDKWIERTYELFREKKILIAKKKVAKSQYNVHEITNKLYRTIPLVPVGNLMQDIAQDIQAGLYNDCGDPNIDWDSWKNRCIEILSERGTINVMDSRNFISANPITH